ncbi:MAG: hypothetical protein M1838_003935, partial [Thelocarpon superellum]
MSAPAPVVRRAHTLPVSLTAPLEPSDKRKPKEAVEVLYWHDAARIVAFKTPPVTPRPAVGRLDADQEKGAPGTLPWASRSERVLATGPLQLYRAQSSVVILNSGAILHALFAKSQCWCVDGESKFVLRIRDNDYYRIELPHQSDVERSAAELLKEKLATVLQFEKTPCPFKRGFTVELPEPPHTPVKKRPWRPRVRVDPEAIEATEVETDSAEEYVTALSRNNSLSSSEGDDRDDGEDADDANQATPRARAPATMLPPIDPLKTPTRPKALGAVRSMTAPPQLNLTTTPPSRSTSPADEVTSLARLSLTSSTESFHSVQPITSSLPPSPPDSSTSSPPPSDSVFGDDLFIPRHRAHADTSSSVSTAPGSRHGSRSPARKASPPEPNSITSQPANIDPMAQIAQTDGTSLRAANARRRLAARRAAVHSRAASSPIAVPSPTSDPRGHHLTTALLQRTCALMMCTPAQLMKLMLEIARKVANGALQGVVLGYGEGGEKIPCQWVSSEDEQSVADAHSDADDDDDDDVWSEDDYGVPLGRVNRNALRRRDI